MALLNKKIQRWGSTLNLNVHCHILCPDGVYTNISDDPRCRNVDPISDTEVAALVERIAQSVMQYLMKVGYLDRVGEIVQNPKQDDLFAESESLSPATACSIARGPLSNERLAITADRKVKFQLKSSWNDSPSPARQTRPPITSYAGAVYSHQNLRFANRSPSSRMLKKVSSSPKKKESRKYSK